ncbi:hypothetical protein CsSME_00034794 [Camellia sinensis var. sinensis]
MMTKKTKTTTTSTNNNNPNSKETLNRVPPIRLRLPARLRSYRMAGVRISHFPPMIKHTVNRPHSSVLEIVALEKAIQCGEGKNLQNGVVLENVSHGQLQALSAVPADSPASAGD